MSRWCTLRVLLATTLVLFALGGNGCGGGGGIPVPPIVIPPNEANPIPGAAVNMAGVGPGQPGMPPLVGAPGPGAGGLTFDEAQLEIIWNGAYDPDAPTGDRPAPAGFWP